MQIPLPVYEWQLNLRSWQKSAKMYKHIPKIEHNATAKNLILKARTSLPNSSVNDMTGKEMSKLGQQV
jgi:hypothetical protein